MFVADDLGGWLVALLADAGRKRLINAVLGPPQERALRQAATAAIMVTAGELNPQDSEQAGKLARVISEVFGVPPPAAAPAGRATVLAGHLVGEIVVRGSAGGLLAPLASQLGHDRTYLELQGVQGQLPS